jgi:homoserine dehydrogenase
MKQVKIGLIGFGTIGSAVYHALKRNSSVLASNLGAKVVLRGLCDKDRSVFKGHKINKKLIRKNADEIINDPEINIVIELIGGIRPAKDFIINSLKNRKFVITANKALLSKDKKEIFEVARKNGVAVFFEASVLAGVPVIKVMRESLIANSINSIKGIINGTSNYILSAMFEKNISFKAALKEAQQKGYAERNYALDVEGHDSAHKLAILSSLAFSCDIRPKDIYVEGISSISNLDVMFAKELGYSIKLLAVAKRYKDAYEVRVQPALVPKRHMLASVEEAYNAVYLKSDLARDIFLYGQGAGGASTSSGVLSDVAEAAKCILSEDSLSYYQPDVFSRRKIRLIKANQIESCYYVRFMAKDTPGVLAKISGILAKHKISIASVMQKARNKVRAVPIIMLTHQAKESELSRAIQEIDKQRIIMNRSVVIKMEKEG